MLTTTTRTTAPVRNRLPEEVPALPQVPEGYFWRISDRIYVEDGFLGPGHVYIADAFDVQLHKAAPTFLRPKRSYIVAHESVYLRDMTVWKQTVAQATVAAAERVMRRRGERIEFYTSFKRVRGDYS